MDQMRKKNESGYFCGHCKIGGLQGGDEPHSCPRCGEQMALCSEFPGLHKSRPEDAELKHLRQRVQELERENRQLRDENYRLRVQKNRVLRTGRI